VNDTDTKDTCGDAFRRLVTDAQSDLFAFIALMVGNTPDAWDVLQGTNLALMKKAAQYETDRPFRAWARSIAYYEVLTFRQRQRRERLVFDDDMLDQVSATLSREETDEGFQSRRNAALAACLGRLLPFQRTLIVRRYEKGVSVSRLAQEQDCSAAAISTLLYRIRKALEACIRSETAKETSA